MAQENRTVYQEKISPQSKRRIVCEVKKKISSASKMLKSLVDSPCSTRIIRRHLNNKNIQYKKIIHRQRFNMKHKLKRMEYARQYQTISARKWRKVVFLDEKKFNLDGPDGVQMYWHAKYFPGKNYPTRHSEGGYLIIWGGDFLSSGKLKLQFVSSRQKVADYVKNVKWFYFS